MDSSDNQQESDDRYPMSCRPPMRLVQALRGYSNMAVGWNRQARRQAMGQQLPSSHADMLNGSDHQAAYSPAHSTEEFDSEDDDWEMAGSEELALDESTTLQAEFLPCAAYPLDFIKYAGIDSRYTGLWRSQVSSAYKASLCRHLKEFEFTSFQDKVDKIFACAWLNHEEVLWGTKDNQLLHFNVRSYDTRRIPLAPLPPGHRRPAQLSNEYGKCGIHCISINPSRTLMATGGDDPNDVLILSLPDFKPQAICVGHQDWLFQAAWLSDQHVTTCGRDGKLLLWRLTQPEEQGAGSGLAVISKPTKHKIVQPHSRCRDMAYCATTQRLATISLGPQNVIKLWDPITWRFLHRWQLKYPEELIAVAHGPDLVAAAGKSWLVFADPREPGDRSSQSLTCHAHHDDEGVRSLKLNDHIVSCGGAGGRLMFFDLRMYNWVVHEGLDLHETTHIRAEHVVRLPVSQISSSREGHRTRIRADSAAVYCHEWDESGLRMLAGGGPLHFLRSGVYAAMWT